VGELGDLLAIRSRFRSLISEASSTDSDSTYASIVAICSPCGLDGQKKRTCPTSELTLKMDTKSDSKSVTGNETNSFCLNIPCRKSRSHSSLLLCNMAMSATVCFLLLVILIFFSLNQDFTVFARLSLLA